LEECNAAEHAHIALSLHRHHCSDDERVPDQPCSSGSSGAPVTTRWGSPLEEEEEAL